MNKCVFILGAVFLLSCGNNKEFSGKTSFQVSHLKIDSLPNYQPITMLLEEQYSWSELNEFQDRIQALYEVTSTEDLKMITEELSEKLNVLQSIDKPEVYQFDGVNSRMILMQNFLKETLANIEMQQEVTTSIADFLTANQSLLNQLQLLIIKSKAPKLSREDLN